MINYFDKRSYKGSFSNGKAEGKGLLKFPDGKFLEGEFAKWKLIQGRENIAFFN